MRPAEKCTLRLKLFIATVGLLLGCICSHAQFLSPYNFKFKTYTTQDGLADNTIVKIAKDKRGFLWIATHNGISRFDGLRFKNYTHVPGDTTTLRSIWITDMVLDASQTLWASTEGGICYYDEKYDRFRYINKPEEIQLIYKAAFCISKDQTLWVAGENGLKKINTIQKSFEVTALNRIPDPQAAICDKRGNILIGTRGFGMYQYNIATNTARQITFACLNPIEHVMGFYSDEEGIWAATSAGLLLINNESHAELFTDGASELTRQRFEQMLCINAFEPLTQKRKLLCGTYDKKFLLFDKITKKFIYKWSNTSLSSENVPAAIFYNLYPDNKILWMATDYGLCNLSLTEQDFVTTMLPEMSTSKTLPVIKKIIPSAMGAGKYWIISGPPSDGLFLYDGVTNKLLKHITGTHVINGRKIAKIYSALVISRQGNLYALSDSCLDIFLPTGVLLRSYRLPLQAYMLVEDDEENIWMGSESGIIYVNKKTGSLQLYHCKFSGTDVENSSFSQSFRAEDLALGNDSVIWMSSIKYGLFSFNKNTGIFTPHRQPFNGSYTALNRSSAVVVVGNKVWFSNMAGLSCYDVIQNSFTNYNISNGLNSTYVYALQKDSLGHLWGRGNAGIFSFNLQTENFTNYTMPLSFLGSLIFQKISPLANGIAVGFEGGFTIFSRLKTPDNGQPLPIITNCKVADLPFYFDKDSISVYPASFSYNQNILQFQFTAIRFNRPQNVTLYYMLEGLDTKWTAARGNNIAAYNNLPEGRYQFKVMAADINGLKNSKPAIFRFTISPPFWRTWWFRLLLAVAIITTVVLIFRWRVQAVKNKEAQKTAINKTVAELEMKTLRSRMNPHFIFNSLNSIQKFIWENKKDDASDYLSKFAKLMRLILDHSSHTYITLSEELDALKIYIELEHRRCNGRFEYAINVDENVTGANIKVPPLILQPFVENAIWHGLSPLQNRHGILSVTITKQDGMLVCQVCDNGIGRTKAAELKAQSSISKTSVGVDITRQRLQQMNTDNKEKIYIETRDLYEGAEPAGTYVSINIPEVKEDQL